MPSKFLYIDTNVPTFTGDESSREQVDIMMNYLHMLVEQLRYTLNNLSSSNFNRSSLNEILDGATEDVSEEVTVLAGQLNTLNNTVSSLSRRISAVEGMETRLAAAETDIDGLQAQVGLNTTTIANATSDISTLRGSLNGALARIATIEDDMQDLLAALTPDGNGNIVIGGTGKTVDLNGTIRINGQAVQA